MEYYSIKKKNEILPFATTWMDLECITLSEKVREWQILYVITYMWNLKKVKWMTITKQKQTHVYENKLVVTGGVRERVTDKIVIED